MTKGEKVSKMESEDEGKDGWEIKDYAGEQRMSYKRMWREFRIEREAALMHVFNCLWQNGSPFFLVISFSWVSHLIINTTEIETHTFTDKANTFWQFQVKLALTLAWTSLLIMFDNRLFSITETRRWRSKKLWRSKTIIKWLVYIYKDGTNILAVGHQTKIMPEICP